MTPPLSARRLSVLVAALPVDSATAVALGAHTPGWSTTEELLALVAELVDTGNRYFYSANSKRGTRPPDPVRITRPNRRPRRVATSADLVEMFGGVARRSTGTGAADT